MTEPKFEYAMQVTLRLKKPRLELANLPVGGNRLSVQIEGGEFDGPTLKGIVRPGGGEWPHVRTDGVFCFDARYQLQVDDGTIITINNRGYRHADPAVMERLWHLEDASDVKPDEYYLRSMTMFDVPAGKHDWMGRHVFVGIGERLDTGNRIRYFKML